MSILAGSIGASNVMVKAALLFGVCAVLASIAQLALLRRINLVPATIGLVAITFFTNVLGQTMGLVHGLMAAGSSTPAERQVLFGGDIDSIMKPMFLGFVLLILATLLLSIAATLRANLRPKPQVKP